MNEMGEWFFVAGLLISVFGLLLWSGAGRNWSGRLPGDIHYSRGNLSFSFPIASCLVVSALLTFLMWLFRR